MIECLVDPRWSFKHLLGMHKATERSEVPDSIFLDHSKAVFVDHRGLVPDPSVSMISRGISFGHSIILTIREFVRNIENTGNKNLENPLNPDKFVPVPSFNDDAKYDEIRTSRYHWGHHNIEHRHGFPKVLTDHKTGAMCYFSPSLNTVRNLGPDFDFNPMNYTNLPKPNAFSNYKPSIPDIYIRYN